MYKASGFSSGTCKCNHIPLSDKSGLTALAEPQSQTVICEEQVPLTGRGYKLVPPKKHSATDRISPVGQKSRLRSLIWGKPFYTMTCQRTQAHTRASYLVIAQVYWAAVIACHHPWSQAHKRTNLSVLCQASFPGDTVPRNSHAGSCCLFPTMTFCFTRTKLRCRQIAAVRQWSISLVPQLFPRPALAPDAASLSRLRIGGAAALLRVSLFLSLLPSALIISQQCECARARACDAQPAPACVRA